MLLLTVSFFKFDLCDSISPYAFFGSPELRSLFLKFLIVEKHVFSLTRKQPEPTMHKYICDLAAGCINNSYKIVRKGTYDLRVCG